MAVMLMSFTSSNISCDHMAVILMSFTSNTISCDHMAVILMSFTSSNIQVTFRNTDVNALLFTSSIDIIPLIFMNMIVILIQLI